MTGIWPRASGWHTVSNWHLDGRLLADRHLTNRHLTNWHFANRHLDVRHLANRHLAEAQSLKGESIHSANICVDQMFVGKVIFDQKKWNHLIYPYFLKGPVKHYPTYNDCK
jgi:hypothetical protein